MSVEFGRRLAGEHGCQYPRRKIRDTTLSLITREFGETYEIGNRSSIDGSALICQFFFPAEPFTRFHVLNQVENNDIMEARNYWAPDEEKDMPDNIGHIR